MNLITIKQYMEGKIEVTIKHLTLKGRWWYNVLLFQTVIREIKDFTEGKDYFTCNWFQF